MWAHTRICAAATALATAFVMFLSSPANAATQPDVVTGLKAVPSTSSVKLSWDAAGDANTYRVCLLTSAGADTCYRMTDATTARSMTISGLKPTSGTDYFFRVHAYNGPLVSRSATMGFDLTSDAVTAAATKPAVPTGLRVTGTAPTAVLSWNAAAGATSYRVCVRTSTTTPCVISSPPSAATSVALTGLRAGSYVAKVSAYNSAGYTRTPPTALRILAAVKPGVPTGVKNVATTSGVTVTWNAASNAQTYKVCLLEALTSTRCARTSAATTGHTAVFTGLRTTPGADYYSRISAYNGDKKTHSALARFDLPVGTMTGFRIVSNTTVSMYFAWEPTVNADTYDIELATKPDFSGTLKRVKLINPTETAFNVKSLIAGTTYYSRIIPRNSGLPGKAVTLPARRLPTHPFTAKVITYNLCGQNKCVNSTNKMKTWTYRKPLAGAIARSTGADIIATQESHSTDTNFITQLPGFSLAAYKSAKSLFYKTSKYTRVRYGTFTLDSARNRYAVWAEFEDKLTRTNFIVTDAHLEPYKNSTSTNRDNIRYAQTKSLLSQTARINPGKLPVVHAGDFNSNKSNASYPSGYDAPDKAFTEAGIDDSYDTAATLTYAKWNSSNQAKNPPVQHYDHIDHIYVDPRIVANAWRVVIKVTSDSPALYVTPFATDHNPVRAELVIPGQN